MKSFAFVAFAGLATARTLLPKAFSLEGEGYGPINQNAEGEWVLTKGKGYGSAYFGLKGKQLYDSKKQKCYQTKKKHQLQCDGETEGEYFGFTLECLSLTASR